MINKRFNPGLAAIVVAVLCILTMIVGAGAIAMQAAKPPLSLIKVPGQYASIQQAVDAANPGDVIQVDAGIYQGTITLNKPVTLVAANFDAIYPVNNTVVLDGMGGDAVVIVPPNMSQMPILRGFIVTNAANGVLAGSPLVIESSYFNNTNFHVNYQDGSGGINRGNIYIQSRDDAIHVENAGRPLLIENNRILYAGDDGIEIGFQITPSSPASAGIDVWNNMIIGSRQDGIQVIDYGKPPEPMDRRLVVVGNLIANNQRAGLGVIPNTAAGEDYSAVDSEIPIRVYKDTFYGNDVAVSGGDDLVAFNNIFANSKTRGAWKVQGPAGSNSVIAYSLFFNNVLDADQSSLGSGNILGADPLFSSPPNPGPDGTWGTVDDDFSGLLLSAASPAIDKGVVQYLTVTGEPVPPNPITGFTGSAPDLGWREYGSAAFVTPTPTLLPTITIQPSSTPFVASPVVPTASPIVVVVTATPLPPTATPPQASPPPPSATSTLAASATPTPGLAVTSLVPISGQAGSSLNVTLLGSGFVNGTVVTFEGGLGNPPQINAVQVLNPQTIVLTLQIPPDLPSGPQIWDMRVTNPDMTTAVLEDAFTVTPAP